MRHDDPAGWQTLDGALTSYLNTQTDVPSRWLLIQTLATSEMRRRVLATLDVQTGWRTLDVGTGFGSLPMELAAMVPVHAVGVDVDESTLRAAETVRDQVAGRHGFVAGSQVTFRAGDAYALDEPDASVDLATARFLFQHLRDHAAAAAELARVVRPGGLACLIDVDDGLSLTYPEPSPAYLRLTEALTTMQERQGGGRHLARTLPARLDEAGFEVVAVLVLPQAAYRSSKPGDMNRTLLVDRFLAARRELVERYISAEEFDDCLGRFAGEVIGRECAVEAHLAVVGRRR
jgi:ubiquinone/menaquinone biosynthesis C-methylase UbiE